MLLRRYQPDPALAPLMEEWRRIQVDLAARAILRPLSPLPRLVAGVDCALSRDGAHLLSVAVVWDREEGKIVETAHGHAPLDIPYIPGYLGFRESPAILMALRALETPYGAVLFDGMGIAHPRRCGIAVQVSVALDVPGIGVGKSRLYGRHAEPGPRRGDAEPLIDPANQETIGWVLRSKDKVRPLYVSPAHRTDLESARKLALSCLAGYRLPEPTRLADKLVGALKATWTAPAKSWNTPKT